jgi:hypothetical protein
MALREKSPLGLAPLLGDLAQGAFLLAPFMALFRKQNSVGKNPLPLVRRVARRSNFEFHPLFARSPRQPSPALAVQRVPL